MSELISLASGTNTDLYTDVIKDGLKNRILIFNENVTDDLVEDYMYHILKWNMEDKDLPQKSRKKIKILFNSGGGDVIIAFGLIDVIQSSETPIVAIGLGLVASAAFYIYIGCHTRMAFPNTVFLQHDGELTMGNTHSKVKETMAFIDEMDSRITEYVLINTTMTQDFYDEHYAMDYYMYAEEAKENGAVDMIIGKDIQMAQVFD